MIARLALVAAALSLAPRAFAQTTVDPGTLTTTTDWTIAGSPYTVRGDVVVPAGVTLTVDADVVVRFAVSPAGSNLGEDATRSELVVDGTLVVSGGATSRAQFRADSGTDQPNQWRGIVVRSGGVALIDGAEISSAWNCLAFRTAENVYVRNSLLRRCAVGALVTAGTATFDAVEITTCNTYGIQGLGGNVVATSVGIHHNNADGIYVEDAGADVNRGVIHDNGGFGVHAIAHAAGASAGANVMRSTIVNNRGSALRYEQYAGAGGVGGVVRDNILAKSGTYAIEQTSGSYLNVGNNLLFGYNGNPYSGGLVVWDDLKPQENPLFVDEAGGDLRITRFSPARLHASDGGDVGAYTWAGEPAPFLAGHLHEDLTLSAAASPYDLAGNLTVAPGRTLTVEPGATIRARTTNVMGFNSSSGPSLYVDGTLVADGTDAQLIVFESASGTPTRTSWFGISLRRGSGASVLDHVVVRHAWTGIKTESALARVTRSEMDTCSVGLSVSASTVVDGADIHHGWDGVFVGSGSPVLRNLLVHDNAANGLEFDSQAATSVEVVHATVANNGEAGLYANRTTSTLRVRVWNSILAANGTYGIRNNGASATIVAEWDDVWGNGSTDVSLAPLGTGSLSVDPEFVSTVDFHLAATSPLIDLGTDLGLATDAEGNARPVDANGCDGAVPDLGAYEAASTGNQTPVAIAGADVTAAVGEEIPFNGTYSFDHCGYINSYDWAFGDGSTAMGAASPGHAYASAGDYTVTLTVSDPYGALGTDTLVAHITSVVPLGPVFSGFGQSYPTDGPLTVFTKVTSVSGITSASVHYRTAGDFAFTVIPMTAGADDTWSAQIPAPAFATTEVEYYFHAVDGASNQATLPPSPPANLFAFGPAGGGDGGGNEPPATGGGDGGGGGCRTAEGGGWALLAVVLLLARMISTSRPRAGTAAARSARARSCTV